MTDASPTPALTIARSILCAARRDPSKVAIVTAERTVSYYELAVRIGRAAALATSEVGARPGDRVLLIANNCAEYFELVAGISDAGVAVATLNPRLAPSEIERIIADCEPVAAFVDPALPEAFDACSQSGITTLPASGKEYEAMLIRADPSDALGVAGSEDCFAICYTSGTTGKPKGVMLSHRSRVLTIHAMAAEYGCFGRDDHFLGLTPLCHGAGFAFAVAPLLFGGTVTLGERLDAACILERIGEGDITGVFIVPTHAQRFSALGEDAARALSGHSLKSLISNAAGMPQPLKHELVQLFGEGLYHETYGSTEAGIVTNIRPDDQLSTNASVGTPFPNVEVELRGDEGEVLEGATTGELFSRAPYAFNGYLKRPDETAMAFRDGWVTVGDIARRDEKGFYHIIDRKSDLIISGGMNVYPKEIETVAAAHPQVSDAAAVGIPDREWGEAIHLFYVSKSGANLDAELAKLMTAGLAAYKRPKAYHRLDELPRNPGGKILRRVLRVMADS